MTVNKLIITIVQTFGVSCHNITVVCCDHNQKTQHNTPEEGWKVHRPKNCEDENNGPNNPNYALLLFQ